MRRRLCPLFWLALPAALAHAANDVPDWVKQAASAALPSYPAKVTNVTLLREEAVTVDVDGHRVMPPTALTIARLAASETFRAG